MATVTNGCGRGIHRVDGVWPHQAILASNISGAAVPLSATNSQTCSWGQQDSLNLIIPSVIQFEVFERIY